MAYTIYCDDYQEGMWFKQLNPHFSSASLALIPSREPAIKACHLDRVLKYDRPDIILQDDGKSILVLERTSEVPSGHNVGQRYGRLLAAAEERIPVVYFGPYMAYKHGGHTAGPRYMNLRLFYSLQNVSRRFDTAVTTINWPVDRKCEVLKTPEKDIRVKKYLELFFSRYDEHGFTGLTEYIKNSGFQKEQEQEQKWFADNKVQSPGQYNYPPKSVQILSSEAFWRMSGITLNGPYQEIVVYDVGMTYIRSDPYAGMAALYRHLYCQSGAPLVLRFGRIKKDAWYKQRTTGKTYRMFKQFADAIWFQDGFVCHDDL